MAICYLIIPATNSAKDSGDEKTFKKVTQLECFPDNNDSPFKRYLDFP